MPALTWPGLRTAKGQAALYHARERRRALDYPNYGLFVTHRFRQADGPFDVATHFPDRSRPITFAITVRCDGPTAQGIIFEAGNATTGFAIWISENHEDIVASVGDAGAGGATVTASNALLGTGQTARIVVAVIPGSGEIRIWINGELLDAAQAVTRPLPNGWAAAESGDIGQGGTTTSARVPAGDQIALVGATIMTPLEIFQGQRPWNFSVSRTGMVVATDDRITELGELRITEDGEQRITE